MGKHVVPDGKHWAVEEHGKKTSTEKTQRRAAEDATARAKRDREEVSIHGRDGRIREKNSFGNDPYPPKG